MRGLLLNRNRGVDIFVCRQMIFSVEPERLNEKMLLEVDIV